MRSFQILLRLKQAAIILICTLGFTASQLAFVGATPVVPVEVGGSPYITVSSPNLEINVHGCATIPLEGQHFTPSGKVGFIVTPSNGSEYDHVLPISPTGVSVAVKGNFFIPLYVCKIPDTVNGPATGNLLLTVVDKASGLRLGPVALNVSAPVPSIYAKSDTAPLLNDCGTVVVFGDGFVASTEKANYASISGFESVSGARLRGSARANVLVNGNIAISVQFCGLKVGDTFFVRAVDMATNLRSGDLSFTAVAVTPQTVTVTPTAMG